MTSLTYDGGTIIYIQQDAQDVQYKINNESNWTNLTFPVTITNTNTSLGNVKVLFTTNITITSTSDYFTCNSSYIQFGSDTLNDDGTRPTITVSANNYDGFIKNGEENSSGNSHIYIYNLIIDGGENSTQINGGWFGKSYFANGATNNFIVNCKSIGTIANNAGGILGSYAASNSGNITLTGCSSSGSIGENAGGIVGNQACYLSGTITCNKCWSTGSIGQYGGGILGAYAGVSSGTASATNCYSTGLISSYGGGIFGSNSGNNAGTTSATNCYSLGEISTNAGGIFGTLASNDGGNTTATNCFSKGTIQTASTGIFAPYNGAENVNQNQCYAAEGSWSSSTANSTLSGTPPSQTSAGTVWVPTTSNQPYQLNHMGFTPYAKKNIDASSNLIQTYSQTIVYGQTSIPGIQSNLNYAIIAKSGGDTNSYSTITINGTTGAVLTTLSTVPGVYTLVVGNDGSYNVTELILTVTAPSEPAVNWLYVGILIGVCVLIFIMHSQRMRALKSFR